MDKRDFFFFWQSRVSCHDTNDEFLGDRFQHRWAPAQCSQDCINVPLLVSRCTLQSTTTLSYHSSHNTCSVLNFVRCTHQHFTILFTPEGTSHFLLFSSSDAYSNTQPFYLTTIAAIFTLLFI